MTNYTKWSLKIKNHHTKGKIALKVVKSPLKLVKSPKKLLNPRKTGKIASKLVKLP